MGNPIVKLEGKYLVWSGPADAPATYGMTLEELQDFVREEDGRRGLDALRARLERVEAKGTSSHDDENALDTVWLNRAGPRETPLHLEEIIEFYIRRCEDPTPETLAAFRVGLERCGPKCPAIPDADGCANRCDRCNGTDYVRKPRTGAAQTQKDGGS